MMSLSDQTVLVAGGAGEVGEGIVGVLLEGGANVLVPSRSAEKLAALQTAVGTEHSDRLHTLETDIGTPEGIACLRSAAQAFGPLRAVVVSVGNFWHGPPAVQVPPHTFDDMLRGGFFTYLSLVQTLLPLLKGPATHWIKLNGLAAVHAMPGLSALSVGTAAQLALTRSLIAEAGSDSPRITDLVIEQFVRTRSRQKLPDDALTAREVGVEVAKIILTPGDHALLTLGKSNGNVSIAALPVSASSQSIQRLMHSLATAG